MVSNLVLKMLAKKHAFFANQDGATAIEYGLIAAGIAVAISAVVFTFGDQLTGLFRDMGTKIDTAQAK